MRQKTGMNRDKVRRLCETRPDLTYREMARHLGVTASAVSYLARQMGFRRAVTPQGCGTNARYEAGCRCGACRDAHALYVREWRVRIAERRAIPTRWRCLACGGRITASVAHQCRPAEPLTTGLVWTRGAA